MIIVSLMSAALALPTVQAKAVAVQASTTDVTYTIPVSEGLDAPLTMVIENASFRTRGDVAHMSFRLPEGLTGGVAEEVRMRGPVAGDAIEMKGPSARASCKILLVSTDCTVTFEKLKEFTLPGEISEQVQEVGHQPIGIISFPHQLDTEQASDY